MADRLSEVSGRASRGTAHRLVAARLRGRVACVDLETTGGRAADDRIIEVGIVLLDDGAVVEEWSSLVNPQRRIPSSIQQFTGIDESMVAAAPTFAQIAADVRARLAGRLFVAHNARFDYGFLRGEYRRLGERFSAPVLCTVRLSRALYAAERRHNLDAVMERHGLECSARHRALGDARVLPGVLRAFESSVGAAALEEACVAAMHEPRLPPHLPPELVDDLPDAPGVYVFRGASGEPLYVGKSTNIRSRVLAHFAAAPRATRERRLATGVRDVTWTETGGELGALLLEARLVRDWLPEGNRRLRPAATTIAVRLESAPEGVVARIEPLAAADFSGDSEVFGPFRSLRDARRALEGKARAAELCLKSIGLEAGSGSCFGFQVGRCRGACVGRESRALHDARLRLSLMSLKLASWPFPGAIGIRERAPDGDGTVLHVVDRWRHLGTAASEDELDALLSRAAGADVTFDVDSYRILGRCLKRVDPRDLVPLSALRSVG
jgi:DNA polymerase-3 subunit epsilon